MLRCDIKSPDNDELWFNVMPFSWATLRLREATRVYVELHHTDRISASTAETESTPHNLRVRVLRSLEEILRLPRDRRTQSCLVV
jgi:hypothetical protein